MILFLFQNGGKLIHAYKGGYWEAKQKQDWSMCPDIFWIERRKKLFPFTSKKKNRRFVEHNFVVVYEASSLGGAVLT